MSVDNFDYVDGIAVDEDGTTLIMLIADHLPWDEDFEFDHLTVLQDKIQVYCNYVETNQYNVVYPNAKIKRYRILIDFKHGMSENCIKFLDVVGKQLAPWNIEFVIQD